MGGPIGMFFMLWYDFAVEIAGYIISCFMFLGMAIYILLCTIHAYMSGEVPKDMSSFTKTEFTSRLSGRSRYSDPVYVKITNISDKPILLQNIHYYIYDCPSPDSKLEACTKDDLDAYETFSTNDDILHTGKLIKPHDTIVLDTHIGETLMDRPHGYEVDNADVSAVIKTK